MVFKLDGNINPVGYVLVGAKHCLASDPSTYVLLRHFYVTMNIGDPAKPYFLSVDTGSGLAWLTCAASTGACDTCEKGTHKPYQPAPPSYTLVPCVAPLCDALHQDLDTTKHCTGTDQCDYKLTYADGASTGVLVTEKFSLPMTKAQDDRPRLAFGCGYDQGVGSAGKTTAVDGILGLGQSSVDLVSQLKDLKIITKNVIGHCFSTKGGGYLFFGEDNVPSSDLSWVPMAPRAPETPYHYSAGQATLHWDTESIGAKPMEVILDSGIPYTYFPDVLHSQLVSALKASLSNLSLAEVHDPTLPLCWKGNGPFKSVDDLKKEFKSRMSLNFGQGATMVIPPENYLIVTEQGNTCLGIFGMTGIDVFLIGGITMQDQLVIYDNEKGRLGWTRSLCDSMPISKNMPFSRI
ncbi:hypothetical protein EJB05_28732, partial [Eragrostis curvula]